MQPLSRNQRPDLLVPLITCLLYCACHGKFILADPLQMSHACHRVWKCYKTPTFCSLLTRCTIPCDLPRETTSKPPKVDRTCRAFNISTSKCGSRHKGVHFFTSHLASWLRTRRFSEPTFRPSGATSHWKNTMVPDFPTFFARLDLLLSSLLFSDSSHLCFSSVHIVGSLTSKLPSSSFPSKLIAGWMLADSLLL